MKSLRVLAAIALSGIAGLTAVTWAVGAGVSFASGGGSTVCDVPSRYPTVQAAVDEANCRTIRVAPGAYAESVVVNRSVTLQGAQAGQDARGRRGRESVVSGGARSTFTITADDVTIDGFTLHGPVDQGTAALVMPGGNSGETVQNNVIDNPGRAASITTSRSVFRRNAVRNATTAGDGFQGNSRPIHDVTIADNTFSGSKLRLYHADITFIEGDRNLTVSGNRSTGDGTLVALFKTTAAHVTGNVVTGDGSSSAIYLGGADHNVTVSGNTISAAGSAVKVANDAGDGPNSGVTISRNRLRGNGYGVNVAKGSTSAPVHATRNTITGSTLYGVYTDPSSGTPTDATCNWWGTSRGPGPAGPGHAGKVSPGVIYKPWLKLPSLALGCH